MDNQKVMLITGTRKSIGRRLAEHYTQQGYQVIGCSREAIDFTLENYQHFIVDVADEEKVLAMFADISKQYGQLDVLINNAGVNEINYGLLMSGDAAKHITDTNFIGTFLCSREAVKLMQSKRYGRIVNFSTIAVPLGSAGTSVYSSSKAAIEQFGKVFAREVAPLGITVNTLALSFVKDSGMTSKISEEATQEGLGSTISKAWLETDDIVHALDFYISEKSGQVLGQTIYLGGV